MIIISTEKNLQNGFDIYGENKNIIPFTVLINELEIENLRPDEDPPFLNVIPAKTRMLLLKLAPKNRYKGVRISYKTKYFIGDYNKKHNDEIVYLLPFQHGKKYFLSQGYNGSFSHQNLNAIDFNMDEGTPIHASRGGIVFEIKEDSMIGGKEKEKYHKHSNFIKIYHRDGSYAVYSHLKYNGVLVNVGEVVSFGQLIGYSGDTGWSSGPHLHFDINVLESYFKTKSIPTKFLNHDGKSISLKEGYFYYGTHPEKPKYKVVFGRTLKNEDYEGYTKKIDISGKIDFRTEMIDRTTVLFIANGFDEEYEVTMDLKSRNLKSSRKLPIKSIIPPSTEIFGLLLKPINLNEATEYEVGFSYKPKLIIKEIRNEEFESHTKKIKKSNEIEIRKEDIGNNFVLFLKNGLLEKQKVTIDINPNNMKMSKDSPLILEIESLREKFLLILSPIDINKGWSYSVRYSFISVRD